MIAASLIGILCGGILGLRFKVAVLVPVVMLAIVTALAASLLGVVSWQRAGIDLLAWGIGLEVAYAMTTSLGGRRALARSKPSRSAEHR